ncbi:hypothetical protein HX004_08580 [Myroides sp. 1354]|uniref:hypothetical protein n=1 Tax=unclassified Myroides TaxID=2642485 RepID=UPI00257525B9|nr:MULTISPECIES: hypothetical protein [unclassified Myroides]MDM1045977.1 hypothetical protein [Myroides sp. R163-1]MDM1055827.1 hypothetical protein [Myroides sp. 1354]MDM1070008.1 hypothetical protein [Myroides sp. 1372]
MPKVITVPKDQAAQDALNYDYAASEQLIELELTKEEFEELWNDDVFTAINRITGSNIDDFEDEHIMDLQVIEHVWNELKTNQIAPTNILQMFELALIHKTSIHFYF